MKILVIGGTGLVGRYLLPELVKEEDEIYVLTRTEMNIERIIKTGARPIIGNIRDLSTFNTYLPEMLELIVLLTMPAIRPGQRITKNRKSELRQETNDFFQNAMDLARQCDVPIILPGGTSFTTGPDEIADESWPFIRDGLTEIGADTDAMVERAIRTNSPKVIQLIYGRIYGDGGLFRFMYNMMEKGRGIVIGKGDNYIPNIYAGDAAAAIIKAIEKLPIGEKFIIIDDTPVTQNDFTNYMAELMKKKRPVHLPGLIFRLIMGKDVYKVITMNCIVSNEKAKRILGWQPKYPSFREGLTETINEIRGNNN